MWKPLAAAYLPVHLEVSHPFQVGDSVYVWRHQSQSLEPCWKGPYTVFLMTPTALKVDSVVAWINVSHAKPVPLQDFRWTLWCTQNLLKLRLVKVT